MGVALVGFDYEAFATLHDHGMPVSTFIYNHRLPTSPVEGVTYIPVDKVHHMFEGAFAPDLDPVIEQQVTDDALIYFERTHYRTFKRRTYGTYNWDDVVNHFKNALQFYWTLLRRDGVDTVIFQNVPHGGSTIILYHLAKAMGIRVLVLFQSQWPNLFWAAPSIEELGIAGYSTGEQKHIPINPDPAVPFYMKGAGQKSASRFRYQRWRERGNYLFKTIAGLHFWNRKSVIKTAAKLKWLRLEEALQQGIADLSEPYDAGKKFVYFPLHLQPEMSTDILGGPYADQLRAIEELSRALPDDVMIYVKENPKQSAYMRGSSFFSRLAAIPRVKMMEFSTPSIMLVRDSIAVGTITGTAGWEALQMDKPAIVFGKIWYRDLPGAMKWEDRPQNLFDAPAFTDRDSNQLRTGVDRKSHLLWPGVLQKDYAKIVPDYDKAENSKTLGKSIMAIYRQDNDAK